MALPKGKLMALLAVFAAIGIITATGAFTSVTADRTATVNVQGDAAANLQLVPYNGPNGIGEDNIPADDNLGNSDGYADIQDGTLQINLGGYDDGTPDNDQGVNYDAVTEFHGVFNITNNANNSVWIQITPNGDHPQYVTFHEGHGVTGTDLNQTAVELDSGSTMVVSIKVDLDGQDRSDFPGNNDPTLISNVTITATDSQP